MLALRFPLMTLSELSQSATEFTSISSHGIMKGYVAALDGWLCHIHVLYPTEVKKSNPIFHAIINAMDFMSKPLMISAVILHL
jgi:hypothetical protein